MSITTIAEQGRTLVRIIKSFTAIDDINHDWTAEVEEVFRLTGERAYIDEWGDLRPYDGEGQPPKHSDAAFTTSYQGPDELNIDELMERWAAVRGGHGERIVFDWSDGAGTYAIATTNDKGTTIDWLHDDGDGHIPFHNVAALFGLTMTFEWEDVPTEDDPEAPPLLYVQATVSDSDPDGDPRIATFWENGGQHTGTNVLDVFAHRSALEEGVLLIQLDSNSDTGPMKIMLNDGVIYRGDPT